MNVRITSIPRHFIRGKKTQREYLIRDDRRTSDTVRMSTLIHTLNILVHT